MVLPADEECICHKCNSELPRTNLHLQPDNRVEKMFWGKVPIVRATSYFYYHRGGDFRLIVHRMKYSGHKEYGQVLGRIMATELKESGFFDGIDGLVPVPLHPDKLKKRGYNQSEWLARGVSQVTGIPLMTDAVKRSLYTETQTRKTKVERWENVNGIFTLNTSVDLSGKHLLIIDDVLTTGATTTACADAFQQVPDIRISVLTLALAQ
jgi:ComF family protein